MLKKKHSTGRISIPFTEKNGVYSEPPANAQTAFEEFEKTLLTHNPRYLVFGWPCFWWLHHYSDFNNYLRNKYNCIMENERL
jgi:hypothetical protein